jgi:hypothetical protein
MKKRFFSLCIFVAILACCIGIGLYFRWLRTTHFNDTYVNGNTAGNLYNAGLFCEYDGIIYFANPSDDYHLYSMQKNGSELTKLSDDIASFINVDEHYIYYVRNNPRGGTSFSFLNLYTDSLCRIDRATGDNVKVLEQEPTLYASLVGNYIYYLRYDGEETTSLYKVKIDGSDQQMVDKNAYFTCSTDGKYIYYNGRENDHYIWRLDTEDDLSGLFLDGNCWMPTVVDGNTAYYMDCDNNYRIARVDCTTGNKELITQNRVDGYNLYGDYIYFLENGSDIQGLSRVRTDGTGYENIVLGVFTDVNVTSDYVYFRDFDSGIMYRAPLDYITNVKAYTP